MFFETLVFTLIYIGLFVGAAFLVLWFLAQIGIVMPPNIIKVFWAIVVLVIILIFWKMLGPTLSSGHLPGFR